MFEYSGTSASGLAILGLQSTEKEAFEGRCLQSFKPLWKALSYAERDDVLFVAMYSHSEEVRDLEGRGAQVRAFLRSRDIQCVVTLDGPSLRTVSSLHGKVAKLIGATIQGEAFPYVIPLKLERWYDRQYRAEMWNQAFQKFVRRGKAIAEGRGKFFAWPQLYTGENDEVYEALKRIKEDNEPVGLDLETSGRDFRTDRITAVGIGNKRRAVSIPWDPYLSARYGPQPGCRSSRLKALAQDILGDHSITKIFHNGAFDKKVLRARDIELRGPCDDTLLAHKIVYPDLWHNLQFVMSYEFALDPWKSRFEQSRKKRGEPKDDWESVEPLVLHIYNAQDAGAEPLLWERLSAKLDAIPRGRENYETLKELAEAAAEMQYHGVRIDTEARDEVAASCLIRVVEIEARWRELAPGVPLSGEGSKKALETLFFSTLGAPVVSRSKRTDKEQLSSSVLLEYAYGTDARLARIAFTLFEYRKIKKAYDAFIAPLEGVGRVHACPQVAGTRGTRFSYSKPNLQQWSKEKTITWNKQTVILAPSLRHLILPDSGCSLGEHDYNALEARLVSYAANCHQWLAWLDDARQDMHCNNTELMFKQKVDKKSPLRQIVKTLTFARFYNSRRSVGQVLRSLKPSMPDLTEDRLLEIFERFDAAIPQIVRWQTGVDCDVRNTGYVDLPLSGMRQLHDKKWPDLNAALSFGIQSTAGDIINRAYLRILPQLDAERGERILINVHDALIWQAPPDRTSHMAAIIKAEMERPVDLWQKHRGIVLPTECKVGPNWRDLKLAPC